MEQPPRLQQSLLNRDFLIEWNYRFPIDRWWREKHGVALFSQQHLDIDQLSITNEYHESLLFDEFEEKALELEQKEKAYERGIWISKREPTTDKEIADLFDRIDVSTINNNNSQLQFED